MKRVKHSAKLSEIEIDMRLKEYFSDHQIMQRSDFQGITMLYVPKAMLHIRRLRGKTTYRISAFPVNLFMCRPDFMEISVQRFHIPQTHNQKPRQVLMVLK